MIFWKSFGASVCGPGHMATGTPNQDAWSSFHYVWGDGIVISDGVGSRPFSNFGSKAACLATEYATKTCCDKVEIDHGFLLNSIRIHWLSCIAPLKPSDCAATCLFALRSGDGIIHLGMLGDGLIAAIKSDGSVMSLSEDKAQGFSNITVALSLNTSPKDWQYLSLLEEECDTVLMCTDGVADDLTDIDGFIMGFAKAHRPLAAVSANRRLRKMLENWPTPKHSDDKTIACLCREEVMDEYN